MSAILEFLEKIPVPDFPPDELLIETDGVPLETDWHRLEINLLIELVHQQFAGRDDFFAGGNMFLYFNEQQVRNKDYRGPDFFFVWGASPMPLRPYWAIWKEGGRYPNLIVELLSPTTAEMDRTTKKDLYERTFHTSEYFCYDPDTKTLEGWRLHSTKYVPLEANEKGWLWSEELKLWLGTWNGVHRERDATWLRLYTKQGRPVPTDNESAKGQIAAANQKATTAEQKAATAEQLAAIAQHQADEQRRRAEIAEAELARVKTQFKQDKD